MQADLFDDRITPERVLRALQAHCGASNGISARHLVRTLTGEESAAGERALRHVIEAMRTQGHRVCAHPSTGYFLAECDAELDATCEFLFRRAMTSLRQIAGVKRVALPQLRGQLRLPMEASDESEQ